MENKERGGPRRDKGRTKQLLLDAVHSLFMDHGFEALRVNRVARKAGRSHSSIHRCFGSFENLLLAYFQSRDYWTWYPAYPEVSVDMGRGDHYRGLAVHLVTNLAQELVRNPYQRQVIRLNLTSDDPFFARLNAMREAYGEPLFAQTQARFARVGIDLRKVMALLIGGVMMITLHTEKCGPFCGTDIFEYNDLKGYEETVKQLVDLVYDRAARRRE